MRNKKVLFIVQAALIAAIYVALTYLSSIAGLMAGMFSGKYADRRDSGGCCVRKHCNFDWSVWNLCIKKA